MNFGKAIKAARNYLDLTQPELAEALNMSKAGIVNLENGETRPQTATERKLLNYFSLRGIIFDDNSIQIKTESITTFDGPNWWNDCLDDVYETLFDQKDKELLLLCANDRLSSSKTNDQIRHMRSKGISVRQIIQEGDTYMMGDEKEYKWIPEHRFSERVSAIYGDKYIVCAEDNSRAIIFKDIGLAEQQRAIFETLWGYLPSPNKRSTADERF
jgi:transcriptional regulator with XRE-family HTH domain